jgi:ubiquitin-protein ligase
MAPVADTIGILHYLMYPADGAMADKPLCGRVLIPKEYPELPPVVHLLTPTNRYNVDVYNAYSAKN